MKESDLQKKIVGALRSYSGWWYVTHGGPFQEGGLPDIIGCYAGYFYGLEVKLPGKEHTLTPRQSHILNEIRKAGGKSAMVTSVSQAMDLVFGSPP